MKIMNGKKRTVAEVNEIWQKRYREEINQLSLTQREVFLALFPDKGITPEQLEGQITNGSIKEFKYTERYYRGNPLIDEIGNQLGYTKEQLYKLLKDGIF